MKKGQRGFTVLEIAIVVGISTIIMVGVFGVFQAGNRQAQLSQVKMTLENSGRRGLSKMAQEIRLSAPSRITFGTNNTSIQFSVPDPANLVGSSYTIDWANAHNIQYALGGTNNQQLLRTDLSTNQAAVVANDVTAIQFTGDAVQPSRVTTTISLQRTLASGRQIPTPPLQITTQTEVRN